MHLKHIIYFLLFITITGSSSSDWEIFKSDYDKQYASPEEEAQRQEIFLENVNQIKEYQRTHPDATFTMKINHLADRRIEELVSGSTSSINIRSEVIEEPIEPRAFVPIWLDWRFRNVTTPVYNQGMQASGPAIVAVEVLESFQAIQKKNLVRGSVNQVYSCCGNVIDIFDCILSKLDGGICSDVSYNASNGTCDKTVCEPFVVFNNIKKIETVKETTMLEWIQDSPLYVAVDARQISFQTYETGIYSEINCSKTTVTHALQLIGYGFQAGIPYWLCKNSWGEQWGERGYIRIERGRNMCGIASAVVQIENKVINNAVRLLTFDIIYLAFFCLFVHIFANLK